MDSYINHVWTSLGEDHGMHGKLEAKHPRIHIYDKAVRLS